MRKKMARYKKTWEDYDNDGKSFKKKFKKKKKLMNKKGKKGKRFPKKQSDYRRQARRKK